VLHDQPHADRSSQVVDDVALVNELVDHRRRQYRVDDQVEGGIRAQLLDILDPARREVVQGVDLPAGGEQPLAQMRADEARAPGHQGPAGFAVHARERNCTLGHERIPRLRSPGGGIVREVAAPDADSRGEQECGCRPTAAERTVPTSRPGELLLGRLGE
jgi:hypothetical protein